MRSEKGHTGWDYHIERHKSKTAVFVLHTHTDLAAITLQNTMRCIKNNSAFSAHILSHTYKYIHARTRTHTQFFVKQTHGRVAVAAAKTSIKTHIREPYASDIVRVCGFNPTQTHTLYFLPFPCGWQLNNPDDILCR